MWGWLKKKEDECTFEVADADNGLRAIDYVNFNGKAVKIIRSPIISKTMEANDTFRIQMTNNHTGEVRMRRDFAIEKPMRADEIFTLNLEDELGYKTCLIGGFGQIGD